MTKLSSNQEIRLKSDVIGFKKTDAILNSQSYIKNIYVPMAYSIGKSLCKYNIFAR
jgi:hypothetical protein